MTTVSVEGLSKTYFSGNRSKRAIASLDFDVEEHEFISIVGPSGCGKTTLLKCMSGLQKPSSGVTLLNGKPVTEPPADLALVFQDYSRSLFPWLTVEKNVALPLRARKHQSNKAEVVAESLAAVGLADVHEQYPWQLSGGMQQRVAIARALAYQPKVLLMDEPFASVDAQTRGELEDLVLKVRQEFGVTVILVTHDIDEAVYMADRVIIISRSPSEVTEIVRVELPNPRDQIATKELPEFAHLRAHTYRAIRDQATGVAQVGMAEVSDPRTPSGS
ncbi:MAG: ABC transporter ATP-binding protein [Solirubrobacterales bacterium]